MKKVFLQIPVAILRRWLFKAIKSLSLKKVPGEELTSLSAFPPEFTSCVNGYEARGEIREGFNASPPENSSVVKAPESPVKAVKAAVVGAPFGNKERGHV